MKAKTIQIERLSDSRPAFVESLQAYQMASQKMAGLIDMLLDGSTGVELPGPFKRMLAESLAEFREVD